MKNLHKSLLLLGLFLQFLGFSCDQDNAYKKLNKVKINYVDKDILTFFSVSCEDFEMLFGDYKTITLTDRKDVDVIKSCLRKLSSNSDSNSIDCRVKVYLYNNESLISVVCFDRFGELKLDNIGVTGNQGLVKFINSKID